MTTDLQTVGPDERFDLAALVMDRRRIRQLLVVDDGRRLLGVVSYRALLRLVAARRAGEIDSGGRVREFMDSDPLTVRVATPLREAIRLMLESGESAVPVLDDDRVAGLLSEHDIVRFTGELMEAGARAVAPPS